MKITAADFESMNYGELETFEEIVGSLPTDEESLEKVSRAKLLIALGYIAAKRTNPDITLDEVRELPMGAISFKDDDEGSDPS